jgi:ferrous iron transport protein B
MVLALNVLNSIGTDGSFGNEDSEHSVLSAMGRTLTPVFSPMGIEEENWPATVGIFTGVLAKEAVVGTLNSVYSSLAAAEAGDSSEEQPWSFWAAIGTAVATVPQNLAAVGDMVLDPLGMDVGDIGDIEAAAVAQEVNTGLFGAMASRFDGQVGAFAYLLFILLYFPCVATIAVIVRETGAAWATFVATWTTGVAYTAATLFYQIATFERHPTSSLAWVIALGLILAVAIASLRVWAGRGRTQRLAPVEAEA